jgi:hypothetical protein
VEAQLRHVLWIGGGSGAGKTTIARRIARRHGLRRYNADARTWAHRDRAIAAGHPAALRWEAMTPEERWVRARPSEQLELSLHAERGPMLVDDLRRLPSAPLVVAEGTTVSPTVASSGVADRSRAVWLLPTPEFMRARFDERGPRPSDALYRLVGLEIEREARAHAVPILVVDGSRGIEAMAAAVEELFASALAEGPRAETAAERRALLREANEAVVSQCLAYLARPWAGGDPETMVRSFVCECDDPECDVAVDLAVAAFERAAAVGPVVAAGHG